MTTVRANRCPVCRRDVPPHHVGACALCYVPLRRAGVVPELLGRLIGMAGFDTVHYTEKELEPFQELYDAIRADGAAEAVEKVAQKYDCVIMRDRKTRLGDAIREIGRSR